MLVFLNIFYTILHLSWMVFNLTGWIRPVTRKAHLVTLAATVASWVILGIWYGWGYCPLTDWHWNVKQKLRETNLPNSFVKYIVDRTANTDIDPGLADKISLACLVLAVLAAIYVNFLRKKKPV